MISRTSTSLAELMWLSSSALRNTSSIWTSARPLSNGQVKIPKRNICVGAFCAPSIALQVHRKFLFRRRYHSSKLLLSSLLTFRNILHLVLCPHYSIILLNLSFSGLSHIQVSDFSLPSPLLNKDSTSLNTLRHIQSIHRFQQWARLSPR